MRSAHRQATALRGSPCHDLRELGGDVARPHDPDHDRVIRPGQYRRGPVDIGDEAIGYAAIPSFVCLRVAGDLRWPGAATTSFARAGKSMAHALRIPKSAIAERPSPASTSGPPNQLNEKRALEFAAVPGAPNSGCRRVEEVLQRHRKRRNLD